MRVAYLEYVFSVEKEIRISNGSSLYLKLKPIIGVKYPKRILKLACHYPIASICVEAEPEVLNTEICDVQQSV
jgi:hypothetical protein